MKHAYITPEAGLQKMGSLVRPHPRYDTGAVSARLHCDIPRDHVALADEILRQKTGIIRTHVRSALAQLGIQAFEDAYTTYELKGSTLVIDTLLTDLRAGRGSHTIAALYTLFRQHPKGHLRLAHTGLFPDEAKVKEISFPIQTGYTIGKQFAPTEIGDMLAGSAREWIQRHRHEMPALPGTLDTGAFFLGGIDAKALNGHTVLIDPDAEVDGAPSAVSHLHSHILQKGRSHELRQVELFNKGPAVPLGLLRITGTAYECANSDNGV